MWTAPFTGRRILFKLIFKAHLIYWSALGPIGKACPKKTPRHFVFCMSAPTKSMARLVPKTQPLPRPHRISPIAPIPRAEGLRGILKDVDDDINYNLSKGVDLKELKETKEEFQSFLKSSEKEYVQAEKVLSQLTKDQKEYAATVNKLSKKPADQIDIKTREMLEKQAQRIVDNQNKLDEILRKSDDDLELFETIDSNSIPSISTRFAFGLLPLTLP